MGFGSILGLIWTVASRAISGRGASDTMQQIKGLLLQLGSAESEVRKAEIEREIVQLKAIHDLQQPSSRTWFSPMMIGQYLVVIPFGLWWAAIFIVSILNENLGTAFVVQNIPPHIFDMAEWLIPTIVVGTLLERRK